MPDRDRVSRLAEHIETGKLIEALTEFYHPDVVMQENSLLPRVGLAVSLERQKKAMALTAEVHEVKIVSILVDGDLVAMECHAEWTTSEGARVRIEQVSLQTWRDGKVIHERFFYDPTPLAEAGIPLNN